MAHEDDVPPTDVERATPAEQAASKGRRRRRIAAGTLAGLLVLGLGSAWLARERIADTLIADQLESLGLPARYTIESIGPDRQVLRDVVIGAFDTVAESEITDTDSGRWMITSSQTAPRERSAR